MKRHADELAGQLLGTALHSLRQDILPLLKEDADRIRLDHITRLLRASLAQLEQRPQSLAQMLDDVQRAGIDVAPLERQPTPAQLEHQRLAAEQRISRQMPELLEAASQGDDAALTTLEQIVGLEKNFYVSQDPDILKGSTVVYRGGRIEDEATEEPPMWPEISADSLTRYLQERFGRASVAAKDVRNIPGGFSKDTVFFTLIDEEKHSEQALVIRKDMPVPFIDQSVCQEFPLLQTLHKLDYPVARPLWLEARADIFGGSFIVSERVAGSSNASAWAGDPQRVAASCRELARTLAALHRFSAEQLNAGGGVPRSAGDCLAEQIERWTTLFYDRRIEPTPLQEMPLLWLARNIPEALYQRPAKLIHGDFGFHNMMFDDSGKVTAVLDWEFSGLGDPTQDLCFVRLFIEPLMDWAEFVDMYRSYGGDEICEQAMAFFDLWIKTRNSIGCVASQRIFKQDLPLEMKFALTGYVFGPYLHIEECETVLSHIKSLQSI